MNIPIYEEEYSISESNFYFPEDNIVPDITPEPKHQKAYHPTIWKAILQVDIERYAVDFLGYEKDTAKGIGYFKALQREDIKISRGRDGTNTWRSRTTPDADIIALIKRGRKATTSELASEIKKILKVYQIPYYDKFEEKKKQAQNDKPKQKATKTREFVPPENLLNEWGEEEMSVSFEPENQEYFFHNKEYIATPANSNKPTVSDAERVALAKSIELNRSLSAIEKISQPFFSSKGKIQGIPQEFIQIMGSKLPESSNFLKNQEERKYIQNLIYYTERETENGVKKNLNFLLKDTNNKIVGMAQNDGETGEPTGGLVKGSEEAFFIAGNRESKNIIFSSDPYNAIAFNIDKKQSFANTYHFASVGDFPYKRLDELKELLKERIREGKPTFFRLAFDTDVRGDNKIGLFEKEFRSIFDNADPEKFKMIDSRCNKNSLNYKEQIGKADNKEKKQAKQNNRRPK